MGLSQGLLSARSPKFLALEVVYPMFRLLEGACSFKLNLAADPAAILAKGSSTLALLPITCSVAAGACEESEILLQVPSGRF